MHGIVLKVETDSRHNEIRDTIANVMDEVCHDAKIEPLLQPLQSKIIVSKLTTKSEEICFDNETKGLWGLRFTGCFIEMDFFLMFAKTWETVSDPNTNHKKY